jgi:hypothetical protein
MRVVSGCLFLGLLLVVAGCSSQVGPSVKGQVLFDGKPVAGARVIFEGKGGNATVTDKDGKFFLDGKQFKSVKPGTYVVRITKHVDKSGQEVPEDKYDDLIAANELVNKLPPQYGAAEENPLSAEIKEGANELPPFQLKSN